MLIEVIGTPGSGKSTLLDELFENKSIKKDLNSWNGVQNKAILNFVNKNSIEINKYFKLLFKLPIIKKKILDIYFQQRLLYSTKIYSPCWIDFSKTIISNIIENEILENNVKPHYIKWELIKIAKAHICMDYIKENDKNIILDEGVITSLATLKEIEFPNKSIIPDVVLFVKTEPETILKRLEERQKNKMLNSAFINKTKNELSELINNKYNKYLEVVSYLEKESIPVIIYDYRKDNKQKIVEELIDLLQKDKLNL